MAALNSLVSESIDVVVHCSRDPEGPRVTEILAVEDQAAGFDSTQFTVTDLFHRPRHGEPLEWTGLLPLRAARALERAGYDLRDLLGVPESVVARPPDPSPAQVAARTREQALDAKVHQLRSRRSQAPT